MKPIKNARQAFPMFFSMAVRNHNNELFQVVFCGDANTAPTFNNMFEFLQVSRLVSNMVSNSTEKHGMTITQTKGVLKFIKSATFAAWRNKLPAVFQALDWQHVEVYAIHTRVTNVTGEVDSYFN